MKQLEKTLANKFIIHLAIKTLGPDFSKAMYSSLIDAYGEFLPDRLDLKRQFISLMEYFYNHLDDFAEAVREYLSYKGDDKATITLVKEAMDFENSQVWVQEKELCRKHKEEKEKEKEIGRKEDEVMLAITNLGEPFADYLYRTAVADLYALGADITKESVEKTIRSYMDSFINEEGKFDSFVNKYKIDSKKAAEPQDTLEQTGFWRDAKGRLRDAKGHFVKEGRLTPEEEKIHDHYDHFGM